VVLDTFPVIPYPSEKNESVIQEESAVKSDSIPPPPSPISVHSQNRIEMCVICQDAFQPNDQLREIPMCGHYFHRACIDLWLLGCKMECPICKTTIVLPQAIDNESSEPQVIQQRGLWRFFSFRPASRPTEAEHPGAV
jgi:hypothetical protein